MFTIDGKTFDKRTDFDEHIIEHAEKFTIISKLGPNRLERHYRETRQAAEKLAQRLANKYRRTYMMYATYKNHGCPVKNFHPE